MLIFTAISEKMNVNSRNRNRGFTLIEIIVVLAILAILAAITIPSITGYIEKANQTKDLMVASHVMRTTMAGILLPSNDVPPNTTIYVVWETGSEDEQGGLFVDSSWDASSAGNAENLPSREYEYNLTQFIGETMLGSEVTSGGTWNPGRRNFYLGLPASNAAEECDFKFSINSSTGEFKFYTSRVSSATWKEGDPYVWFDEIGLDPEM